MVLFANFETIVVKNDEKKNKAHGGKRVMYTSHHPCWDAKNRFALPDKLPFDFGQVAHCFVMPETAPAAPGANATLPTSPPATNPITNERSSTSTLQTSHSDAGQGDDGIPAKLRQLMDEFNVSEADICRTVYLHQGIFPEDTPIRNMPSDYIQGVLVGAWSQVYAKYLEFKEQGKL